MILTKKNKKKRIKKVLEKSLEDFIFKSNLIILLYKNIKRTKKSLDISFNFLFILGVIKLFYFAEKKTNISLYN